MDGRGIFNIGGDSNQAVAFLSDDPYYAGLRARIPNFAKSKAQKEKEANSIYARLPAHAHAQAAAHAAAAAAQQPIYGTTGMAWHGPARGYLDNGQCLQHRSQFAGFGRCQLEMVLKRNSFLQCLIRI